MTGDLGPGQSGASDLAGQLEPYVIAAAGMAAERGDDRLSALLHDVSRVDGAFADAPVTAVEGEGFANVHVTLHLSASGDVSTSGERRTAVEGRIVDLLNEAAGGDGYRVSGLSIVVDP